MIGILGGMGTQAGLDFCNKLAKFYRGKLDQDYPMFVLFNKSNTPRRPENLKKSRQKNSWNQINHFFLWNCIFGSFKLFPSSKIDFWPFLKLQKMEFGKKKKFVKLIYLISRVFLAWTFLIFLAHCEMIKNGFLPEFLEPALIISIQTKHPRVVSLQPVITKSC